VASVLASGNIVFGTAETDAVALEAQIQAALNGDLGIPGQTIVRTREQLQRLWASDPFAGLTHQRGTYLTATFIKDGDPPLPLPTSDSELFRVVGYDADARAVLAVTDNSIPGTTPDFMTWLEQACSKNITTRTWLTIQRVLTKFP
ncbi:MAG TPA: DUF1697 domain-containing protein, partial [Ilumatobacteraceae bacterium]|nr:DUF1697 domain-containing protein [Ilumatobacteraceae bacterium]